MNQRVIRLVVLGAVLCGFLVVLAIQQFYVLPLRDETPLTVVEDVTSTADPLVETIQSLTPQQRATVFPAATSRPMTPQPCPDDPPAWLDCL